MRRGLIMAGGRGTRLYPVTRGLNKHLMPVFDKPMIYYPLSILMLTGIRQIAIVTNGPDMPLFRSALGDGSAFGISIDYFAQEAPLGIADAYRVARPFAEGAPSALILGDNIFHGIGLSETLRVASAGAGATIFAVPVKDPRQFGVVTLDESGAPVSLSEKPQRPLSDLAIAGLYFLDERATEFAAGLRPSARSELEITDLLACYLDLRQLAVRRIGRGTVWMDAGTPESLLDIANFVAAVERRQGLRIGCPEEIAWRNGWLSQAELEARITAAPKGTYRDYLEEVAEAGPVDSKIAPPTTNTAPPRDSGGRDDPL